MIEMSLVLVFIIAVVLAMSLFVRWAIRRRAYRRGRRKLQPLLLRSLAQTIGNGVPVVASLRELATNGPLRRTVLRRHLLAAAVDMENGMRLGDAVDRHLDAFISEHVAVAIRAAEERDRLAVVLPILAQAQGRLVAIRARTRAALLYPVCLFVTLMTLALGISIFTLPKILMIMTEMCPYDLNILPIQCLIAVKAGASMLICALLPLAVAGVVVLILFRFFPALKRVVKSLADLPPFSRSMSAAVTLLPVYDTLAAMTLAGEDILNAARCAARTCPNRRINRQLLEFVRLAGQGMKWEEAWQAAGLTNPRHEWILRNAAAREAPADGFRVLAEWTAAAAERKLSRILFWVEPCGTLLNAALVGAIVLSVGGALFSIINVVADGRR